MWLAVGEYGDGTRIEKLFAYRERGNYNDECERQYQLECWLMEQGDKRGGCTYYSVVYVGEDDV